ncbi:MAG: hypothetical protein A2X99_02320 [Deltaproteobacteria bacterium GWB2_55_19]|nr:MAG: hypothetical protein A2X99_02320 [Deltaproteobacteria bacterium GWB2_55_19]
MLNATQIKEIVPQGGSLLLSFTVAEDGNLTVLIHPKFPDKDVKNADKENVKRIRENPVVISGTAEELDAGFMDFLNTVVAKKASFEEAVKTVDAEITTALAAIKTEGNKKVETARKTAPKSKTVAPAKADAQGTSGTDNETGEEKAETDETKTGAEAKVEAGPQSSLF